MRHDSVFPDEYSIKYDFTGEITNVTPGGVPNTATIRVYDENNQLVTTSGMIKRDDDDKVLTKTMINNYAKIRGKIKQREKIRVF